MPLIAAALMAVRPVRVCMTQCPDQQLNAARALVRARAIIYPLGGAVVIVEGVREF
ncbi:MAG: hypothetical protein ACOY3N_09000 [Bradyrhizobium sp.]|uniref:hypothetical protein n=1 Tax=Bradyrhizobium sp. TaxID=376 RepID=UPI003BF1C64B